MSRLVENYNVPPQAVRKLSGISLDKWEAEIRSNIANSVLGNVEVLVLLEIIDRYRMEDMEEYPTPLYIAP